MLFARDIHLNKTKKGFNIAAASSFSAVEAASSSTAVAAAPAAASAAVGLPWPLGVTVTCQPGWGQHWKVGSSSGSCKGCQKMNDSWQEFNDKVCFVPVIVITILPIGWR